jgi:excisionase family DNA binding protein
MPPSLMSQLASRIQLFGPGSAVIKLPVIGHTDHCADGDRWQPSESIARGRIVGLVTPMIDATSTLPWWWLVKRPHRTDRSQSGMTDSTALDSWLHAPRMIASAGRKGLGVRERTGIFNNRGRAMEDRLLYRVPEVAVILNISRSKVYELFSSGDLGSVKIDRIRLVRSSDLRAYVDGLHPVDTPDRCLASG